MDVDVRKFFDNLDHGHLRRFLQQRVRDGVLEHATADQAEPRRYDPLRGDYRR